MKSLSLKNNVAFISGSTRGIGWTTSTFLASRGCDVILNGRKNEDLLTARTEDIRDRFNVETMGILADFGDPEQVAACYRQIYQRFKRLDIVVNNAGIMRDALIGMIPRQSVDETFTTNALGVIHSIQAAGRIMMKQKRGAIVNVSSIIGVNGNQGQLVYSASKAAVIGATKSAAKELAPHNIRVNCVCPGFIDTDMTRSLPSDKFEERAASIKMGRIGSPEDVAKVIYFLASPLSEYLTGQVIGVDGGMLI